MLFARRLAFEQALRNCGGASFEPSSVCCHEIADIWRATHCTSIVLLLRVSIHLSCSVVKLQIENWTVLTGLV
jgi:hypothetical protein